MLNYYPLPHFTITTRNTSLGCCLACLPHICVLCKHPPFFPSISLSIPSPFPFSS